MWWLFLGLLSITGALGDRTKLSSLAPQHTIFHEGTIKSDGCIPGFWGKLCHAECTADHCLPHAFGPSDVGVTCTKASGTPTSCDVCTSGFWGTSCEKKCPKTEHCDLSFPIRCNKLFGHDLKCAKCLPGWTGPSCSAEIKCPPLGFLEHGSMSCDPATSQKFNTTCFFSCESGYQLTGDSISSTCLDHGLGNGDGVWSASLPACSAKRCMSHTVDGALPCEGRTGDVCTPEPLPNHICIGSLRCAGHEGLDVSLFEPVAQAVSCPALAECGACDSHASCRVIGGKPACVCDLGYYGSGAIGGCARCSSCDDGFEVASECGIRALNHTGTVRPITHDTACRDVNECVFKCAPGQIGNCHKCEHICVNLEGSYGCSCYEGYRLSADGHSCDPVVCAMQQIPFSRKSCAGVAGSYCDATLPNFCEPGYYGMGSLSCQKNGAWVGDASCQPLSCVAIPIEHIDENQPCKNSALPWDRSFRMPFGESCTLRCAEGYIGSGELECTHKSGVVGFAATASCEPITCPDFYVDPVLGVKCSGIHTGSDCVGGLHFQCPEGYVAKGRATCQSTGKFTKKSSNPARCEVSTYDPCKEKTCKNGKCVRDQYDETAVCECAYPFVASFLGDSCELFCPPPATVSPDGTQCEYPTGFREISLKSKSPSAVMIGKHFIRKAFRASNVQCTRIPYVNNYIFDDDNQIHIITSVQHPDALIDDEPLSSHDHSTLMHWVENTTTSYFTFCFSEVNPIGIPHEAIQVNFMVFTFIQGVNHGSSLLPASRYSGYDKGVVEKFIGVRDASFTPLVITTLSFLGADENLCDPLHCECEGTIHNAAVVNVGEIYKDSFSLHFDEHSRYRKRTWPEVDSLVAMNFCGKTKCYLCEDSQTCSARLNSHLTQHTNASCYLGRDASVNWLAIEDYQSSALRSGTASLPYKKISPGFWRTAQNCYKVEFGTSLRNPVVFASLNFRTGVDSGAFLTRPHAPIAMHLEGVSSTAFRVCYKLLINSYEEQPKSQPNFVNIDWIAFHDG